MMAQNKLTSEERSRRMKEAWARRRTQEAENVEKSQVPSHERVEGTKPRLDLNADTASASNEVVTVHFVRDGFTAFGTVWYRGQEISVERGTDQYDETVDRKGNSWLDFDEEDQHRIYGDVFFRNGPWRGLSLEEALMQEKLDDPTLDPDERRKIEKRLARTALPGGAALLTKK